MAGWYTKATLVGDSAIQPLRTGAVMATNGTMPELSSIAQQVIGRFASPDSPIVHEAPGQGYDSFTGRRCDYPLQPAPLGNVPASTTGQQVVYAIRSIASATELRQKIGVPAESSFPGFGVNASAKAKWSRGQATSGFSPYLLVKITVRNSKLRLGDFRLNADAMSLVWSPDFLKQFFRRYGDCFISDYVTGGEFLALYEFQTGSARERQEVSAKVAGISGIWSGNGEFARNMDALDVSADVRLSVFIDGGQEALPAFEPDGVLDFARKFPKAVDPITGSPVLYDTETTSYYKAIGFPASIDLPFAANHRILEDLARAMDRVRAYRSAVNYIRASRSSFKDKAMDEMQIHVRLQKVESKITNLALALAERAWQMRPDVDIEGVRWELDDIAAMLPDEKAPETAVLTSNPVTRPRKNAFYVIRSSYTAQVFDVPRRQNDRGARLQMWDRHEHENQLWRFEEQHDGSYVIRSVLNNLVLDVGGKARYDGAQLITWNDNEGSHQRWRLSVQPDNSIIIRCVMNNKVIDIERYGTQNGVKLQLWTEHGKWNQRFILEEVQANK
jgi:hypothetical protein